MLKLKVQLERAIDPLIYRALKIPLNIFVERHPREADRIGLASMAFRMVVAAQAAKYFAKRKGLVRWRGVIDQGLAKQLVIEIERHPQEGYISHAYFTSIHIERIRLAQNKAALN